MRIVGTNHGGYANARNIAGLPLTRYRVVRARNRYRLANYLYFRLRGRLHTYYPWLHSDFGFANYDLLHFFNGISLGQRPWLSTFETFLPRWGSYGGTRIAWGLEKLASPSCKRLIALSECTRSIQTQYLQDYPEFRAAILPKISVLQPSQPLLLTATQLAEKRAAQESGKQPLRLLFIGADFFRKGGMELLRATDSLIRQGADLHLTIISTLNHGDYATHTTDADRAAAIACMQQLGGRVRWEAQGMPYAQVLDACRAADVGLLPTWADTYGYSALEFMAAGCPVISTDIRALPEINGSDRGWVIGCDKDSWGNAQFLDSVEGRMHFSEKLTSAITATLTDILNDRTAVPRKGDSAFAHIQAHHSPTAAAETLEVWYDEALA